MTKAMDCSVCRRPHHAKRSPFLCAVDARNRLYEARLGHARALLEDEALEQQTLQGFRDVETGRASNPRVMLDKLKAGEEEAASRTRQIIAQADRLKVEIDAARKEIGSVKDSLGRRRSDLASVSSGVSTRRWRQLDETQRVMQRTKSEWNRGADKMAATRAFLCEEAARLYGLRQVKKGGSRRYEIGNVEIVELPLLNSVSPEMISTSLAHVAHILVLASHYLAIRLPSQITLPHRDYPRPTIFSPSSSYKYGEVPFPGSAMSSQVPVCVGETDGHVPRPRPLFVDKPLATLAKEDPISYSLFLEGVTLLAYDVAWACCSQGVPIGDKNSFEDVCGMGQNLWRLLMGDQLRRKLVEPALPPQKAGVASDAKDGDSGDVTEPRSSFGRWSHGTTHTFLGGPEGSELVRSFKMMSPTKMVDRLKKRLSSDAPMIEWTPIDAEEAQDMESELYHGVLVQGHGGARGRLDLAESVMTVQAVGPTSGESITTRGLHGWTKLKSR